MNLEQAIRDRWASFDTLTTLVPLARFWTGAAPPSSETPFVVLDVARIEPRTATSSGRLIQHVSLRLSVVAASHGVAQAVAREIENRFERAVFALDEGEVIDMRRERLEQKLADDGVWTIVSDYLAVTEHFPQQGD